MRKMKTLEQSDWRSRAGRCFPKAGAVAPVLLEHFQAKWIPVRVKKMRKMKTLEQSD
jgi:hypothetical protein